MVAPQTCYPGRGEKPSSRHPPGPSVAFSPPNAGPRLRIREYGITVSCMKATVELPDDLVVAAKKRAAEMRRPLRELVERGLRAELRRRPEERERGRQRRVAIRWVTVAGGLPPGVDVADRAAMHDSLRSHA